MISPVSPLVPVAVSMLLVLALVTLLVPGLIIVRRLQPRLALPPPLQLLAAIAATALLGYATFWCYFAHRAAGRVASIGILLATLLMLRLREERRGLFGDPEIRIPLLAMLCATFFYANLYLGVLPDPVRPNWGWVRHATAVQLSSGPDNSIPLVFARRLYEGLDLQQRIFRDQASDRPPLQTGIALVDYPFWKALDGLGKPYKMVSAGYQVLGVLLQTSWIAAGWALLRGLGLPRRRVGLVLLSLAPVYFFFFNSVYVWPKLLAGSFGLGAFCLLLLRRPATPVSSAHMTAAACFAGLGLLAHGGVATSLLGFGAVLLLPRWFPGWANVARGALVVLALWLPWHAYQRYYDPPGNFILKNHIAGVLEPDDPRTTLEAVTDVYADLSIAGFAELKWRKLRFVLGIDRTEYRFHDVAGALRALRHYQALHLLPSLGLLNIGWLVVLAGLWRGPPEAAARWRALAQVLGVALLCTGIWILVQMSWPLVQHASYATAMLLFFGLSVAVVALPVAVHGPVLALNAALPLAVVLINPLAARYAVAPLAAAALGYAALALVCLRGERSDPAD